MMMMMVKNLLLGQVYLVKNSNFVGLYCCTSIKRHSFTRKKMGLRYQGQQMLLVYFCVHVLATLPYAMTEVCYFQFTKPDRKQTQPPSTNVVEFARSKSNYSLGSENSGTLVSLQKTLVEGFSS